MEFTVKQLIEQLQKLENPNLPIEVSVSTPNHNHTLCALLDAAMWNFEVPKTSTSGAVARIHCTITDNVIIRRSKF